MQDMENAPDKGEWRGTAHARSLFLSPKQTSAALRT